MYIKTRQAGLTLVELIMFIVVVSVGVVGILQVWNMATRHSADPLAYKQAVAIAEALLEEIELQPFTVCDPNDPAAATETVASNCAIPEALGVPGPEAGQQRGNVANPFNNVNDYGANASGAVNVLMPNGILDENGVPIPGLSAYNASVTITEQGIGGVPAAESLRIDVRVWGAGADVTLSGYRLQYAQTY